MDDLGLKNIGFAKIDVEGHEEKLLRGAADTLERSKPNLYIEIEEVHIDGCFKRTTDLLKSYGYQGYFMLQNVLFPTENFSTTLFQASENWDEGKFGFQIFSFFISATSIMSRPSARILCFLRV